MESHRTRRSRVLADAIAAGKIFESGAARWGVLFDADPDGTEAALHELEPVLTRVALTPPPDMDRALAEAVSLFPELRRGRRGREAAQGALSPPSGAFAAPADADGYSWPPPTRPEDEDLTVDRNLTAALFPETRERQTGRVVKAD